MLILEHNASNNRNFGAVVLLCQAFLAQQKRCGKISVLIAFVMYFYLIYVVNDLFPLSLYSA